MIALATLVAPLASSVLAALAFIEAGAAPDSGDRTIVAALITLACLGASVGIGMFMDKRARS